MIRAIGNSARMAGLVFAVVLLAACARQSDLDETPVPLGDFKLGLNIAVADNMQKVPISRDATVEEWESAVKTAIADRFGRYTGNRFYNIGIAVDGYALAPPGIPVVAAPKSVVVISANIWDDASGTRLNTEARQFTVFEGLNGETVLGTGYTRSREQQLAALSYNAARAVQGWLVENPQWFLPTGPPPEDGVAAPAPLTALPVVLPATGAAPVVTTPLPDPGTGPVRPRPRP